jgi:hypothetical protein
MMATLKFECANCGGTFESDRPEEECLGEMVKNFGPVTKDDCGILCDDCYAKFMVWYETQVIIN